MTKINAKIISKAHGQLQTMDKTCAKFQKDWYKIVCGGAHEVPSVFILRVKKDLVHNVEKVTKNNLTIISKPHAYPHILEKTHAKFHNDWYKTVGVVRLTRSTQCPYIEGEK